jgi:hypothetical protein
MQNDVASPLLDDAPGEFDACMAAVLASISDNRIRVALQMVATTIAPDDLAQLIQNRQQSETDEGSARKATFDRVARQLASATRQVIALDLDRLTSQRVLGIGRNAVMTLFCAKAFGHEVLVSCRPHLSNSRVPKLFHVPCFEQKTRSDLPNGQFDLIVCEGNPKLSTMQSWAAFVRPLATALTEDGKVFVKLVREANADMGYEPGAVLASLARIGMRVSTRNCFALITKSQFGEFRAEARRSRETTVLAELPAGETTIAADLPDEGEPGTETVAVAARPVRKRAAAPVSSPSRSTSYWKIAVVIVGAAVIFAAALILAKHG